MTHKILVLKIRNFDIFSLLLEMDNCKYNKYRVKF